MIVRSFRAVSRTIGTVIDEEDRELLGRMVVMIALLLIVIALVAVSVFMVVAAFELARGV